MAKLDLEEAENIICILEKKIRNEKESLEMNCENIKKYQLDIQFQETRMKEIRANLAQVTTNDSFYTNFNFKLQ